ncbi:DNA helicase, ATP-dependent, RecQ type [Ascosphaera apis ARSEF 7405]|uniref:DNA 3'-5' helicase n=1 Tax=Ascosphaera apis ARSEF 7405 TaxID=392613 RepID=A0A167WP86_9EURO|nr:DNA helicase, ATP-dependent, RecQ type [Ascosphaera apis ARSEF 7405]
MARPRSRKAANRALRRRNIAFATRSAISTHPTPTTESADPQPDLNAVHNLLCQNDNDNDTFHAIDDLLQQFDMLRRARIVIESVDKLAPTNKPIQYLAIKIAIRILYPYWPREGQVEAIQHLLFEKQDLILIAATSFGKSLVLQSVSLLRTDSMTIVVIPLNQIGQDQLDVIKQRGGSPCFLNGENNNPHTINQIREGHFTHLFISPELVVSPAVSTSLQTPSLLRKINLVAIDEAHLVHHWGDKFRTHYAQLMRLRIALGKKVPWFACSATLPPHTIKTLKDRCGYPRNVKIMRNPIDRPELLLTLAVLAANPGKMFESLRFLFQPDSRHRYAPGEDLPHIDPSQIPKTIIFFNTRQEAYNAHQAMIEFLRNHPQYRYSKRLCLDMMKVYTRDTPEFDKKSIISKLQMPGETSPVRVVFATEALGMGVDMPDIRRVVQYKLTESDEPSVLWQRGGRACRDHQNGEVILLVEHWTVGPLSAPSQTGTHGSQLTATQQTQSQISTVIDNSTHSYDGESGGEDDSPETVAPPNTRAAENKNAKKRAKLTHFWYNLINNDSRCMREAFLHYFAEPEENWYARGERARCCSKCQKQFAWGVVSLDRFPHCYLYHESLPRTCPIGKRMIKVARDWALEKAKIRFAMARFTPRAEMILPPSIQRVIETHAKLIHNTEGFHKYLHAWRFLSVYGEELFALIAPVASHRPKGLTNSQYIVEQSSQFPSFESQPQSPSTRASSLHNFELSTPPPSGVVFDENSTPASPSQRKTGALESGRSVKRRRLADITNRA